MNPCPCGYLGDPQHSCRCSLPQIQKYRSKVSGPLVDRIDLHIEAQQTLSIAEFWKGNLLTWFVSELKNADQFKLKDLTSMESMPMRFGFDNGNAVSSGRNSELLKRPWRNYHYPCVYGRILKVSRTIADLESSEVIRKQHLLKQLISYFGSF